MQKVLGPIRTIRFTLSTLRQASIREKKGPSIGKYKSKFLISEVSTLWNLRTSPTKRLKDNSDAPEAKHGTLPKTYTSSKRTTKLHSTRPRRNGHSGCVNKRAGGKWVCSGFQSEYAYGQQARPQLCWVVDREDIGESDDGDDGQRRSAHKRRSDGTCQRIVTVMLLEETPAVLSLGKLCDDHGYTNHWTSGQKPHLTKNGKRIYCKFSNYVPLVVPSLSTSSSTTPTPTSSSSSSQDSVFEVSKYTENPVHERSGSTSWELRANPMHKATETENKKKWRTRRSTKRSITWIAGLAAGVQR